MDYPDGSVDEASNEWHATKDTIDVIGQDITQSKDLSERKICCTLPTSYSIGTT